MQPAFHLPVWRIILIWIGLHVKRGQMMCSNTRLNIMNVSSRVRPNSNMMHRVSMTVWLKRALGLNNLSYQS